VIAAGTTTATMTASGGMWTRGETVERERQPMDHLVACLRDTEQRDPRTRFLAS
jgi:hypothetical protein